MLKDKAIEVLGGSIATTAAAVDISYQAVNQWPDVLPQRIADRVIAACVRRGIEIPEEWKQPINLHGT